MTRSLTLVFGVVALGALAACEVPVVDSGLQPFVAVTFNTGTTGGAVGDGDGSDNAGYGDAQVAFSDERYGDGLAWSAAVDEVEGFFADTAPDVVAFQEIFYSGDCGAIPAEARAGFVCESWTEGDATVASRVLGSDYQVACNVGKPDKCVGVKRSFGAIRGCEGAFCLDALDGGEVEGCGRGSRVGRALVDVADDAGGGTLTVVNVHGTSGMTEEDMACRVGQFEQVFEDLRDGSDAPAANGARNLILGDLNTDPGRLYGADPSADVFNAHVNFKTPFVYLSDIGKDVPPSYAGLFNIDHVVSDALVGDCSVQTASTLRYHDHKPLVCALEQR